MFFFFLLFNNHSPRYNRRDSDIGCLHIAAPQWMCSASWTPSICGSSRMWDNPLKLRHSVKRVNDKQWGCSKMKFVGLRASTFLDAVRDSHPVKGSLLPLPVNSAGAMTLEFNFRKKKNEAQRKKRSVFHSDVEDFNTYEENVLWGNLELLDFLTGGLRLNEKKRCSFKLNWSRNLLFKLQDNLPKAFK